MATFPLMIYFFHYNLVGTVDKNTQLFTKKSYVTDKNIGYKRRSTW